MSCLSQELESRILAACLANDVDAARMALDAGANASAKVELTTSSELRALCVHGLPIRSLCVCCEILCNVLGWR